MEYYLNTKKGEGDYDVVLCVDSLKNLTKLGWVIKYNKKEGKDIYEKSKQSKTVIVGVLGNANKGKSFLLIPLALLGRKFSIFDLSIFLFE